MHSKVAVTFKFNVWVKVSVAVSCLPSLWHYIQLFSDTDSVELLGWVEEEALS